MKKHNQRLGYQRLAEVLKERGLVDPQAIDETMQLAGQGGQAFPEALIGANLIADWELSRLVCEIFNLPFLPVDIAPPDPEALEGLDRGFLVQSGLVPLGRFGGLLTVAMPAIVPAETLGLLSARIDLVVLPVVGTVRSNRRWIEENVNLQPQPSQEAPELVEALDSEWSNLFDEGDAAVLAGLGDEALELELELEIEELEDEDADAA